MTDDVLTAELEIRNRKGLHARAAAAFVKCLDDFDAEVTVERCGQVVSGSSIMGLMMLAASKGTSILVKSSGKQAAEALDAVRTLVEAKFGED